MMEIERRLAELGLALPPPIKVPPGVNLPFSFVRIHRGIAYISGHGPQNADGSVAGPFGKGRGRYQHRARLRRGKGSGALNAWQLAA